jgi:hypothetical protein
VGYRMKEPSEQTPVRPAAVHFDAPTHEPLVSAVLITQDPDTGEYKLYLRSSAAYTPPDRHLLALLVQSVEIRNLAERDQP